MVWRETEAHESGTEAFMLFLRGTQLLLHSSVLTVFDLDE